MNFSVTGLQIAAISLLAQANRFNWFTNLFGMRDPHPRGWVPLADMLLPKQAAILLLEDLFPRIPSLQTVTLIHRVAFMSTL